MVVGLGEVHEGSILAARKNGSAFAMQSFEFEFLFCRIIVDVARVVYHSTLAVFLSDIHTKRLDAAS